MRGLLISTDQEPVFIDIKQDEHGSTLDALQKLVEGIIRPFDVLFGSNITLYVNDEGLYTCPPNRAIYATKAMEEEGYLSQMDYAHVAKEGELYTILFGNIVAVGFDPESGDNRDLTYDEAEMVSDYFTKVSGPGSGIKEALAIMQEARRNDHGHDEHLGLKETAKDAKNAADHLDTQRAQDMPERGKDER